MEETVSELKVSFQSFVQMKDQFSFKPMKKGILLEH